MQSPPTLLTPGLDPGVNRATAQPSTTLGPILIDLRGLQGATNDPAFALLRDASAALPGRLLIGLIDPNRPNLAPAAEACLHALAATPHAARRSRPECFVRLAPCDDDPAFSASLLLDPTMPSLGLPRPTGTGLAAAIARYWQSCVETVTPPHALWPRASTRRRTDAPARLAVLTATPDAPMSHALRRQGANVFGPGRLAALSPHYDQTLVILANTPNTAPLLPLLRRYGGSALLLDPCLLAAHDDAQATDLAARELGRPVPTAELRQWRDGVARPPALLLAEIAASADRLFVHSSWLAAEIHRRYGRTAEIVPPIQGPPHLLAQASGLHAESCVWALDLLRAWGREARLELDCPAVEHPALASLATRLGLEDGVGFTPGPAALTLSLAMRGQTSPPTTAATPDIATTTVAETLDLPPTVRVLPDQPSPVLLAEAIHAALPSGVDAAKHLLDALMH